MGTFELPAEGASPGAFGARMTTGAELAARPLVWPHGTPMATLSWITSRVLWERLGWLAAALIGAEALLLWQPALRQWVWGATVAIGSVGAILCVIAGQRHERLQIAWYASAGGCLSLLFGFVARGLQDFEAGRMAVALGREGSGFQGAAAFFIVAALALIQGESVWLRRAKLGLDASILIFAPLVAWLPFSDHLNLSPDEERLWATALIYTTSYAAVCYALVVATRRTAMFSRGSPTGALVFAALLLFGAAAVHAARSVLPWLAAWPLGQTFWLVGVSLVTLAGGRALRPETHEHHVEVQPEAGDDSRLRLVPAALAGLVVVLIAVQQASTRESPTAALFFGSSSLFWLIVSRLLVTLAENRRLVRGMQTADRSQAALRDLGTSLNLNSSLEPEKVLFEVCSTGQAVLRADATLLWLLDPDEGVLIAEEVVCAQRREALIGRRMPCTDRSALVSRVVRLCRPEIVQQVPERGMASSLLTVLLGSQCLLAVPLRQGHVAIGALVFSHSHDPMAFRQEDLARAELLANQAVVALRNAELFQDARRRADEMTALYEYAQACEGATSSEDIAHELLRTLDGKIPFQQATVLIADAGMLVSARGLLMRRLSDLEEPHWDVPPTRLSPLATRAFRTRMTAWSEDGQPDFRTQLPESVAQLAVPLTLRDHAIGVVELEGVDRRLLDEPEARLVEALARHAALAIDNLRLEEDTREVANLKKLDRLKTELLGTVSHELRTPLASIKGYATTLLQHERMRSELRREFLTVIDSESDRLGELINNLLDMSRLEAGVLKVDSAPVRLERVVQGAVERAQHLTEDHRLTLEWRADPWVMADVPRVQQVLTNLLANAIKYSPEGGRILVSGRLRDKMLLISVADSGVGIPPRDLDKIFDRFHRVEGELARRVSGTGLGLAICRGLVEAHGGRIWVESEPGVGSTFTFSLPTCDPGAS